MKKQTTKQRAIALTQDVRTLWANQSHRENLHQASMPSASFVPSISANTSLRGRAILPSLSPDPDSGNDIKLNEDSDQELFEEYYSQTPAPELLEFRSRDYSYLRIIGTAGSSTKRAHLEAEDSNVPSASLLRWNGDIRKNDVIKTRERIIKISHALATHLAIPENLQKIYGCNANLFEEHFSAHFNTEESACPCGAAGCIRAVGNCQFSWNNNNKTFVSLLIRWSARKYLTYSSALGRDVLFRRTYSDGSTSNISSMSVDAFVDITSSPTVDKYVPFLLTG
ncbi:hypothetical protein BJ741DRAFT_712666 [Chytriomyces cf. hyalinus JEL632]|nr:hypothetical protein BJ741DRAFT_712666 [Chytriomyces cf. hyalinus JEL632]